jgi:hypothetical protein
LKKIAIATMLVIGLSGACFAEKKDAKAAGTDTTKTEKPKKAKKAKKGATTDATATPSSK